MSEGGKQSTRTIDEKLHTHAYSAKDLPRPGFESPKLEWPGSVGLG